MTSSRARCRLAMPLTGAARTSGLRGVGRTRYGAQA
jgi:hypothetical protein